MHASEALILSTWFQKDFYHAEGKISFPESQFMVYMTSTISKSDIQDFYEETTGLKDFIVLEDCNHFGINNFHPERKYMVSPTYAFKILTHISTKRLLKYQEDRIDTVPWYSIAIVTNIRI